MLKYLDIILRKLGLVRISLADAIASSKDDGFEKQMQSALTDHEAEIANLNARIFELKRCSAGNAVGMYG